MDLDWKHLPSDPARFFGLDADHDERDLRRAYARAIRRYKPETHPVEFQRIRSAFDALRQDALLAEWDEPVHREVPTPQEWRPRGDGSGNSDGGPEHYLQQALVSDVVEGSEHDFGGWLLAGVRRHPEAHELRTLLVLFWERAADARDLTSCIEQLQAIVGRAGAGLPSYPLWRRLLTERGFDELRTAWDRTWSDAWGETRALQDLLLCRLLPDLVRTAPLPWVEEQLRRMEADIQRDGMLDDGELFALRAMADSRRAREERSDGDPESEELRLLADLIGSADPAETMYERMEERGWAEPPPLVTAEQDRGASTWLEPGTRRSETGWAPHSSADSVTLLVRLFVSRLERTRLLTPVFSGLATGALLAVIVGPLVGAGLVSGVVAVRSVRPVLLGGLALSLAGGALGHRLLVWAVERRALAVYMRFVRAHLIELLEETRQPVTELLDQARQRLGRGHYLARAALRVAARDASLAFYDLRR